MKSLVFAGIDPGTTAGYAAIDVSGRKIASRSAREFNADALVSELSSLGSVLVVCTDKSKVPSLVSSVATRLGARVWHPGADLKVDEKRRLVPSAAVDYASRHEMDAFAAAFAGLRTYERLFSRIRDFLAEQKKPELFESLAGLVVKKRISIRSAFSFLALPERPETCSLRQVLKSREPGRQDCWKLYDALVIAERDRKLLRQQNIGLANIAKKLESRVAALSSARPATRVIRPAAELEQARKTISELQHRLGQALLRQKRLQHMLLNKENYVVAKRLRNFGINEYRRVSRAIGFRKGDVIFVDDPNCFSERVLGELGTKACLAVTAGKVKPKVAQKLAFAMVSVAPVPDVKDDVFAFFDRKAIEAARAEKALLARIVKEYQESRRMS
jgi:predicted RNase H-like nuclease (RuvC/YqgF family)